MLGQLIINGLAAGGIYALLALGFAIIYNTTRMLHIAHAVVYAFGAYAFYVATVPLGFGPLISVPCAVASAALFGVAIEIFVYRPVRRRGGGSNSILIVTLGTVVLVQALLAIAFTTDVLSLRSGPLPAVSIGDVSITALHLAVLGVVLVTFPALQAFLGQSRVGTAIRALADNPSLSEVQGLDTDFLYSVIFLIGSALAGVAAVLTSLDLGVRPEMGFSVVFTSIVAVIIGGVGYLPGALAGAFLLGLVEQLAVWKLNSAWQAGLVFAVLLAFLFVRPQGLFGGRFVVRRA